MGHGHAMWKHALTLQVSYCSPTKLNNRSIYGTSSHGQRVRVIFAASCKASLRQKRASLTTPVLAPANKPWRGSTQPARSHHKHAGTIFSANAFQCQVEHFRPSASEASRWTIQPTVPGRASAQGRQLQAQCLTGQQRKGREASEHMPPLPPLLLLRMLLAILDHLMTGLQEHRRQTHASRNMFLAEPAQCLLVHGSAVMHAQQLPASVPALVSLMQQGSCVLPSIALSDTGRLQCDMSCVSSTGMDCTCSGLVLSDAVCQKSRQPGESHLRAITAASAWTAQDDRQAVTESGADL
jgi:hypothetical protein